MKFASHNKKGHNQPPHKAAAVLDVMESSQSASKTSSQAVSYGENNLQPKRRYYKQREGEKDTKDDDAPDILNSDYPQFVDESKTLD